MISAEQLKQIIPQNKNQTEWLAALNALLPKYEINTKSRTSCFLAQCVHESAGFTALKENLNYSAEGLQKTFAKYFTAQQAAEYARKPERIANRVYANRMGNGDEASGDGYRHCGRGVIQLTGKANYENFSKAINKTVDETVVYLGTMAGALESACWFWKTNKLNTLADAEDMKALTKKINGGYIGLEDRVKHFNHIKQVL
jgi:putative chitinase